MADTNRAGVVRPQDFRGTTLPEGLVQHLLGERVGEVRHACPECGLAPAKPTCPVCLGAGTVSTERLDRYQVDVLAKS